MAEKIFDRKNEDLTFKTSGLKIMQFCDITNQLLEDFPEICTTMEKGIFGQNISYKLPDYNCNCIEINDSRIAIYFTVPEQYRITANNEKCEIMFENTRYTDFALISMYWKHDMNQWWTYEEIKEDIRKMLDFQKKVNGYISLLNFRHSVEKEYSILIDL